MELRLWLVGHQGNQTHHPSFQKTTGFHPESSVDPNGPVLASARCVEGTLEVQERLWTHTPVSLPLGPRGPGCRWQVNKVNGTTGQASVEGKTPGTQFDTI